MAIKSYIRFEFDLVSGLIAMRVRLPFSYYLYLPLAKTNYVLMDIALAVFHYLAVIKATEGCCAIYLHSQSLF